MGVITSGTGTIYNRTRAEMLMGGFRWADPNKWAAIATPDYVFQDNHLTLMDVVLANPSATGMAPVPGPFISPSGWAGSKPPEFSGEVWTEPVASLILCQYIGGPQQPDLGDFTKYILIACLTTFVGGAIYPDGSPFSITYDQSNGQEGWFRP